MTMIPKTTVNDPLYVIFEQYLYNFQNKDIDRKTFVGNVVAKYIDHLRKMKICIPSSLEQAIVDELSTQVNTMLIKKIYGCYDIQEFKDTANSKMNHHARIRYQRLKKVKNVAS